MFVLEYTEDGAVRLDCQLRDAGITQGTYVSATEPLAQKRQDAGQPEEVWADKGVPWLLATLTAPSAATPLGEAKLERHTPEGKIDKCVGLDVIMNYFQLTPRANVETWAELSLPSHDIFPAHEKMVASSCVVRATPRR